MVNMQTGYPVYFSPIRHQLRVAQIRTQNTIFKSFLSTFGYGNENKKFSSDFGKLKKRPMEAK